MAKSSMPPAAGLAQLMDAERRARERYDRLAGYPDDVRAAARILWEAASEAVTTFHSPPPSEGE